MVVPARMLSEPVSELTCDLSGSRKRGREEMPILPTSCSALMQQQFLLRKQQLLNKIHGKSSQPNADLSVESSRFIQSAMTSTSGRPPPLPWASPAQPSTFSPIYNNNDDNTLCSMSSSCPISILHHQSVEVDAQIRLQAEKLRSGLAEACKRQCREVMTTMELQVQKRLAEKQAEAEAAAQKYAELKERLRQAAAESQAWFMVAKNSEAVIAGFRARLERVLEKRSRGDNNSSRGECAAGENIAGAALQEEGYGDSEEEAGSSRVLSRSLPSEEASSSLIGATRTNASKTEGCFFLCRSCGKPDACILLLPCRHLCLCHFCEPSADECPVCSVRKNGSLPINLS